MRPSLTHKVNLLKKKKEKKMLSKHSFKTINKNNSVIMSNSGLCDKHENYFYVTCSSYSRAPWRHTFLEFIKNGIVVYDSFSCTDNIWQQNISVVIYSESLAGFHTIPVKLTDNSNKRRSFNASPVKYCLLLLSSP